MTVFQGDGVLFATSNGSTAYNFAAGGPLVDNHVKGIVVCPICPLSLSFRNIIFPEDVKINLKVI